MVQIDFSADGQVLQSVCNAFEVPADEGNSLHACAIQELLRSAIKYVAVFCLLSAVQQDDVPQVMYWDVGQGRQVALSQQDQRWATWTAKLGFPVMGIWRDEADGTDINSVCAFEVWVPPPKLREWPLPACSCMTAALNSLQEKGLLVVTDDSGNVRLYNFPCVAAVPGCLVYRGHSSHVEMARFSADGGVVVSVGGMDCCVLQWRVCSKAGGRETARGTALLEQAPDTHSQNVRNPPSPTQCQSHASVRLHVPDAGLVAQHTLRRFTLLSCSERNAFALDGIERGCFGPGGERLTLCRGEQEPGLGGVSPGQAAVPRTGDATGNSGKSASIAEQMLATGREGASDYVKRRMAEMQAALKAELARLDAKHARRQGRPAAQVRKAHVRNGPPAAAHLLLSVWLLLLCCCGEAETRQPVEPPARVTRGPCLGRRAS